MDAFPGSLQAYSSVESLWLFIRSGVSVGHDAKTQDLTDIAELLSPEGCE